MADLVQLSLQLEKRSGFPSDLEWGYKDDQLFIFQIRPITRSFQPLTYFVDTNLSESYPGVVSPFTGAFVQKAYENVFNESAIIMGANQKRLEILSPHYARLISAVDDHLYYNLEHYYAVLRALPGGEKNIENWHKMIGGRIEEGVVPYHATELSTFETLRTLWAMIRLASGKNDIYSALLMSLENIRTEIENEIRILKDPVETIRYLNELINRPLGFGLTVVNDIFIMMGLGYLTKVLKGKGYKEESVIDLLKTTEGVDSVKPLEHFNELVKKLSDNFIFHFSEAELNPSFDPYTELFAKFRLQGFVSEVKALEDFLRLYGDRSFEELKLESLPLKNNPLLLKELITWARKNPSIHQSHRKTTDVISMGIIESKILNFTREAISMREATRLWRGKFYHLLRQLVLSLGEQLKEGHSSWNDYTVLDFFSLTPLEWQRFAGGDMSREAAQTLIKKRRPWQTKKKHFPEIISWVKSEPLPEIGKVSSSSLIEGQGVSPGNAEGIALVLDNPQDALTSEYQEFILVTKNTDPAWVYIMSRSRGLISEKGSLLSHTAIIGRELNIPTIVGVKNATQKIKSGDRIRINASKGVIEIL
jgi:pyruvate,water dikinase